MLIGKILDKDSMSKIFYILLIVAILFPENSSGDKLQSFRFRDLDRKKIKLKELYKDGPIAVNVWNLSCEPCKKEMKYLNEYHEKYKDKGFKVVSINTDHPRSLGLVKSYIEEVEFSFTVLSDPNSKFFQKTGGKIMPYLVLINSDGTIYKRKVGFNPNEVDKLHQDIINLLAYNNIDVTVVIDSSATKNPILDSLSVKTSIPETNE